MEDCLLISRGERSSLKPEVSGSSCNMQEVREGEKGRGEREGGRERGREGAEEGMDSMSD